MQVFLVFMVIKLLHLARVEMITTNDEKLYKKPRYLRDHAMSKDKRYWHTEFGLNYRMTNFQASWAKNVYWMGVC